MLEGSNFIIGENPHYSASAVNAPFTTELDHADYVVGGVKTLMDVAENDVTITFAGTRNYAGTVNKTWNLEKALLSLPDAKADGKFYDGTVGATIIPGALSGVIEGDDVSVAENELVGTFSDEYAGENKEVTTQYCFTLAGTKSGNYTLQQPENLIASITASAQQMTKVKDLRVFKNGTLSTEQLMAAVDGAKGYVTFVTENTSASGSIENNIFTATDVFGDVTVKATAAAKDVNEDGIAEYSANDTGIFFTITVQDKLTAELNVMQNGCVYGESLIDPAYTPPAGVLPNTTSYQYSGTLRNGSSYNSSSKPTEAGSYTVTVVCETTDAIYTGTSDEFAILPKNIAGAVVTLGEGLTYNGNAQVQTVSKVMLGDVDITTYCDIGNNSVVGAGQHTLTVHAKSDSNYTGAATQNFSVAKKRIVPTIQVNGTYTFNGDEIIPDFAVNDGELVLDSSDYLATFNDNVNAGVNSAKIVVRENANGNYTFAEIIQPFTIEKAIAPSLPSISVNQKYSLETEQYFSIANAGMPDNAGTLTYTAGTGETTGQVCIGAWDVDANGTVRVALHEGQPGDIVKLLVAIQSENYKDAITEVKITLTSKDVPRITANDITVTFTGQDVPAILAKGSASVPGTWSWKTAAPKNVSDSGNHVVVFKPDDNINFELVEVTISVTIQKAELTGAPTYNEIKKSGMKLAETALAANENWPEGIILWIDADSNELPAETAVEKNTTYRWRFIPVDTENYSDATGTVVLWKNTPNSGTRPITISPTHSAVPNLPFGDVSENAWYYDAIEYVYKNDLMNGIGKNEFNPNGGTTRGMIVTILYRQAGSPSVYSDKATWWSDARVWAMENGISDGTNMTGSITREQLAAMLYRYAERIGADTSKSTSLAKFGDAGDVSSYAVEPMQWAVANGIISGRGNNMLAPKAGATRAETAAMLMRFIENVVK